MEHVVQGEKCPRAPLGQLFRDGKLKFETVDRSSNVFRMMFADLNDEDDVDLEM